MKPTMKIEMMTMLGELILTLVVTTITMTMSSILTLSTSSKSSCTGPITSITTSKRSGYTSKNGGSAQLTQDAQQMTTQPQIFMETIVIGTTETVVHVACMIPTNSQPSNNAAFALIVITLGTTEFI